MLMVRLSLFLYELLIFSFIASFFKLILCIFFWALFNLVIFLDLISSRLIDYLLMYFSILFPFCSGHRNGLTWLTSACKKLLFDILVMLVWCLLDIQALLLAFSLKCILYKLLLHVTLRGLFFIKSFFTVTLYIHRMIFSCKMLKMLILKIFILLSNLLVLPFYLFLESGSEIEQICLGLRRQLVDYFTLI